MEINPASGRILIILIVGLAFCDLSRLELVHYDDNGFVEHAAIQEGLSIEAVRHALTATTLWHPLTWLSHALDRTLFGDGLAGPHVINGALHLGSCLLLFGWLRRFVGTTPFALVVTLLFAVHPMRVESVAWLAERKDVLAAFFYIGAVYAYSIWTADESRRRLFWIAVLAAALGTLSKPSLMTLPIALLLIDAWPLDRWKGDGARRMIEKWPFMLLSLVCVGVTMVFIGDEAAVNLYLFDRFNVTVQAIAAYTWRSFCPMGLAPFEPMRGLSLGKLALSLASLASITVVAFRLRKEIPAFLMGWVWWIALLLPVSGLASQSDHFAPDRYTYLPHVGLFIAVVAVVQRLRLPRPVTGGLATATILLLAGLTFVQVGYWKNPDTLWSHTISVTRKNHVAHHQLGLHLLGNERTEEGLTHLRLAVDAAKGFSIPRGNLALALARSGQHEEAIAEFRLAGPDLPQREIFIGQLEATFGEANDQKALVELLALQIQEAPDDPAPIYRLGLIHLNARRLTPAIHFLERTVAEAESGSLLAGRAHHGLAQAYTVKGDFAKALVAYEIALPLNPDLPVVRQEYAQLLLNSPDPDLRDAPAALKLMKPLSMSKNPRFLRTMVQALASNQLDVGPFAERGLDTIAELRENDPLPSPWTEGELDALRTWFESHLPR